MFFNYLSMFWWFTYLILWTYWAIASRIWNFGFSCFPHIFVTFQKNGPTAAWEADKESNLGVPRQMATFVVCLSGGSKIRAEPSPSKSLPRSAANTAYRSPLAAAETKPPWFLLSAKPPMGWRTGVRRGVVHPRWCCGIWCRFCRYRPEPASPGRPRPHLRPPFR